MPKPKVKKLTKRPNSLRKNRHIFTLNDLEEKALKNYLAKYKIQNKSKFIREILMFEVIRRLEKDQPTLFDEM